jgi:hypothetical protein
MPGARRKIACSGHFAFGFEGRMDVTTQRRTVACCMPLAMIAAAFGVMAQTPVSGPKFEVASVKVSQSPMEMIRAGRGMVSGAPVFSGTRVEIGSMAMKNMIAAAYRLDLQHVTGPAWTTQTFFAIQAVMPDGATKEQFPEMLRALLEERFHLVAQRSVSDQPAYVLTVAKNGLKLKAASEVDRSGCDQWRDDPAFSGAKTCSVVQQPDGDRTTVTIRTDSKWGPSEPRYRGGRPTWNSSRSPCHNWLTI